MIYAHEKNFLEKISKNYKKIGKNIEKFYGKVYLEMRSKVDFLDFSETKSFDIFADEMNKYDSDVDKFIKKNRITSQSKLKATFYEEISVYLFNALPRIKNGEFGVFKGNICAGFYINSSDKIASKSKNVDFCIGKKIRVSFDKNSNHDIIKPIVFVEVKTYTDATMFGEIQHSCQQLKSFSPDARAYVLMSYNSIGAGRMIASEYISINQMFVLRENSKSKMIGSAFREYYDEISSFVAIYGNHEDAKKIGKIF